MKISQNPEMPNPEAGKGASAPKDPLPLVQTAAGHEAAPISLDEDLGVEFRPAPGTWVVESDDFGDDWAGFSTLEEAVGHLRQESVQMAREQYCEGGDLGLYGPFRGKPVGVIAQEVFDRNIESIVFHPARQKDLAPGTQVRVSEGSGTDSGRRGVILPASEAHLVNIQPAGKPSWKENPYGTQYGEPGRYTPFDSKKEYLIRDDKGQVFGMFKERVQEMTKDGRKVVHRPPGDPLKARDSGLAWVREAADLAATTLEMSGKISIALTPEELNGIIAARIAGVNLADLPAALERKDEGVLEPGGTEEDYVLPVGQNVVWIAVDEVAIQLRRSEGWVGVEMYPNNNEMGDLLAQVAVTLDEAREAGGTTP